MNKLFFLLAGCLFLVKITNAQFNIGVKAGANIMKINGQSFNDKFSYNYLAGVFTQIKTGHKISIQPELLWSQSTSSIDSNFAHVYNLNNLTTQTIKLNYISVPVLLNYKLMGNFLTLQMGPQFSALIDKNKTFLQNGQGLFKKSDLSMVGGLQVKLGAIRLNARYVIGLNNINDLNNSIQWRSQGLQLTIGLAL